MAKVVLLDGGVSSRLEEVVGRPLHPQLWSAGEVLTAEGRAAIVVSLTRGSIKNHIPLAAPPSYASSFPRFLLSTAVAGGTSRVPPCWERSDHHNLLPSVARRLRGCGSCFIRSRGRHATRHHC